MGPQTFDQAVMDRHKNQVKAVCRWVLGTRFQQHLDDAVQLTWIQMDRAMAKGAIMNPSAWLRKVSYRIALRIVERERKSVLGEAINIEEYPNHPDLSLGPDKGYFSAEELLRDFYTFLANRCRAEFLDRLRSIVSLAFDGLNQKEISESLGLSQATVHRDIKYLYKLWLEFFGDGDDDPNGKSGRSRLVGENLNDNHGRSERVANMKMNGRISAIKLRQFRDLVLCLPAFRECHSEESRADFVDVRNMQQVVEIIRDVNVQPSSGLGQQGACSKASHSQEHPWKEMAVAGDSAVSRSSQFTERLLFAHPIAEDDEDLTHVLRPRSGFFTIATRWNIADPSIRHLKTSTGNWGGHPASMALEIAPRGPNRRADYSCAVTQDQKLEEVAAFELYRKSFEETVKFLVGELRKLNPSYGEQALSTHVPFEVLDQRPVCYMVADPVALLSARKKYLVGLRPPSVYLHSRDGSRFASIAQDALRAVDREAEHLKFTVEHRVIEVFDQDKHFGLEVDMLYNMGKLLAGQNGGGLPLSGGSINVGVVYVLGPNRENVEEQLRSKALVRRIEENQGHHLFIIKPLHNEDALVFLEWACRNVRYLDKEPGGKFGFVHYLGVGDIREFNNCGYREQIGEVGLVIDVSPNGSKGAQRILKLAALYPRDFGDMFCLIDEGIFSGGFQLGHVFRAAGLAPLISKKSWGDVVGISGNRLLTPHPSMNFPAGSSHRQTNWIIEERGADPDLAVGSDLVGLFKGKVAQLDKAIQILVPIEPIALNLRRKMPIRPEESIKTGGLDPSSN